MALTEMGREMKIQVLGPGCKNCEKVYENVVKAVERAGLARETDIEKVTEIDAFLELGVCTTPGLVIDGQVVSVGRVLSEGEILKIIEKRGSVGQEF